MSRVPAIAAAKPADLAQQKSDFTAEGAPPPGVVGTSVPDSAHPDRGESAKQLPLDGSRDASTGALTTNQGLLPSDDHHSLKKP